MAIIRIKRTTTTNLPTGLTFGELAFVQGNGATANRLYIQTNNAGVSVWIGAEILNSPTYWSGATAETTIPTVSAVESRVVAGGGITFASNLNVNIDVGKFFGKYKKGDIIPAQGQTVKWVIEDAISETITPGVNIVRSQTTVPFGQTANISYTLTPQYQIKTAGATAAGATFEWKRSNESTWTQYTGVFYDTTPPWGGTNGTTFDVPAIQGITNNTLYNTNGFDYRYTVHDTAGASASVIATVSVVTYSAPTVTSFVAAASSLQTAETNAIRERGNSYSAITGTISSQNVYVPLTYWKLQVSENGGAFADTNKPSAGWQAVTPNQQTASINTNHTPSAGLSRVDYRVLITDTYQISQGTTATVTPSGQPGVSFGYRIFYGPTGTVPTTSNQIRGLPGVCMASGTNAAPNPFILQTGQQYLNFVVALPENLTISSVIDKDLLGGQAITESYAQQTDINVSDREGSTKAYNIYVFTAGITYPDDAGVFGDGHRHEITRTGAVS